MASTLAEIREANNAGADPPYAGLFVIYNFPDRDCSAKASDGELHLSENGLERYRTEYIDAIAELVKEYDDIRTIFVYGSSSFSIAAPPGAPLPLVKRKLRKA